MSAYLSYFQGIISWIASGASVLAALAFVWTTLTEWSEDPEDVEIIPLALRAVGYALLARLCQSAATIISDSSSGGLPTLEAMARPVLLWITNGMLALGGVVGLWLIVRAWMGNPSHYSWLHASLTIMGVLVLVIMVRSAESFIWEIMRTQTAPGPGSPDPRAMAPWDALKDIAAQMRSNASIAIQNQAHENLRIDGCSMQSGVHNGFIN